MNVEPPLFDEEVGLASFSGKRASLERALQAFLASYGSLPGACAAAQRNGDLEAIAQAAHTLRGAGMVLGALRLGHLAHALENAHRDGQLENMRAALPQFLSTLRETIAALEASLAARPAASDDASGNRVPAALALLEALAPKLRDGDFAASDMLLQLAGVLAGTPHAAAVAAIQAQFDRLDTDDAAASAEALRHLLARA
jgi:HPt (histidine-containing phosphotransfer) domain-containing protein